MCYVIGALQRKGLKELLQNESFAAALFLRLWFIFFYFCGFLFKKKGGIFELGYSKADREFSRGLSVENFSVFISSQ
mgnify:CR=1 FL=1